MYEMLFEAVATNVVAVAAASDAVTIAVVVAIVICVEREIMVSHLKCRLLLFARSNYKLHNDLLCIYQ